MTQRDVLQGEVAAGSKSREESAEQGPKQDEHGPGRLECRRRKSSGYNAVGFLGGTRVITVLTWSASVAVAAYLLLMLLIRAANFTADGKRRSDVWQKDDPSLRQGRIDYQNNAIYRAFEFWFKITLGVSGGLAYVALQDQLPGIGVHLLRYGGLLEVAAGLVFSVIVVIHQKSKVERWEVRYKWWEPLLWVECWLVCAMIAVSFVFLLSLIPSLSGGVCRAT